MQTTTIGSNFVLHGLKPLCAKPRQKSPIATAMMLKSVRALASPIRYNYSAQLLHGGSELLAIMHLQIGTFGAEAPILLDCTEPLVIKVLHVDDDHACLPHAGEPSGVSRSW